MTFTGVAARTITVGVTGDTVDEVNETFLLNVTSPDQRELRRGGRRLPGAGHDSG